MFQKTPEQIRKGLALRKVVPQFPIDHLERVPIFLGFQALPSQKLQQDDPDAVQIRGQPVGFPPSDLRGAVRPRPHRRRVSRFGFFAAVLTLIDDLGQAEIDQDRSVSSSVQVVASRVRRIVEPEQYVVGFDVPVDDRVLVEERDGLEETFGDQSLLPLGGTELRKGVRQASFGEEWHRHSDRPDRFEDVVVFLVDSERRLNVRHLDHVRVGVFTPQQAENGDLPERSEIDPVPILVVILTLILVLIFFEDLRGVLFAVVVVDDDNRTVRPRSDDTGPVVRLEGKLSGRHI
mmetsp:Transcript_481/g.1085  ORF Transcript_481/g.1085 Transcript_481/m.1085 type:complete len:291 (+) Transcript_481:675-1547(+)